VDAKLSTNSSIVDKDEAVQAVSRFFVYATAAIAMKVKMNISEQKWHSHAQKNPLVSRRLLPMNHPRKLDKMTPSTPGGTP
jgi:hypothetical protein